MHQINSSTKQYAPCPCEKRLGNLLGHSGGNFAYQVYERRGLAPTIRTPSGGGNVPHIITVIPLNQHEDGTCRCIKSQYSKNSIPNFKMAGSWGGEWSDCMQENSNSFNPNEQFRKRVYSKWRESPALIAMLGTGGQRSESNCMQKTLTIYDDYNNRIKADQSTIGTITQHCGRGGMRDGVKIIEIKLGSIGTDSDKRHGKHEVYDESGICKQILAQRKEQPMVMRCHISDKQQSQD